MLIDSFSLGTPKSLALSEIEDTTGGGFFKSSSTDGFELYIFMKLFDDAVADNREALLYALMIGRDE